jgi:hypothetical protein
MFKAWIEALFFDETCTDGLCVSKLYMEVYGKSRETGNVFEPVVSNVIPINQRNMGGRPFRDFQLRPMAIMAITMVCSFNFCWMALIFFQLLIGSFRFHPRLNGAMITGFPGPGAWHSNQIIQTLHEELVRYVMSSEHEYPSSLALAEVSRKRGQEWLQALDKWSIAETPNM